MGMQGKRPLPEAHRARSRSLAAPKHFELDDLARNERQQKFGCNHFYHRFPRVVLSRVEGLQQAPQLADRALVFPPLAPCWDLLNGA